MREQRACTDKEKSVGFRFCGEPLLQSPHLPPQSSYSWVSRFQSGCPASAVGEFGSLLIWLQVLHHMEPLILLQLIDKTSTGMDPYTLVTDGMIVRGWFCCPEYGFLWSLSRSLFHLAIPPTSSSLHILHLLPAGSRLTNPTAVLLDLPPPVLDLSVLTHTCVCARVHIHTHKHFPLLLFPSSFPLSIPLPIPAQKSHTLLCWLLCFGLISFWDKVLIYSLGCHGAHCVVQAFEFMVIPLPQLPNCWDHKHVPSCLACCLISQFSV